MRTNKIQVLLVETLQNYSELCVAKQPIHASRVQRSASSPNALSVSKKSIAKNPSNATKVIGETPMTATDTVALPKTATLADLYDPISMPAELSKAISL